MILQNFSNPFTTFRIYMVWINHYLWICRYIFCAFNQSARIFKKTMNHTYKWLKCRAFCFQYGKFQPRFFEFYCKRWAKIKYFSRLTSLVLFTKKSLTVHRSNLRNKGAIFCSILFLQTSSKEEYWAGVIFYFPCKLKFYLAKLDYSPYSSANIFRTSLAKHIIQLHHTH